MQFPSIPSSSTKCILYSLSVRIHEFGNIAVGQARIISFTTSLYNSCVSNSPLYNSQLLTTRQGCSIFVMSNINCSFPLHFAHYLVALLIISNVLPTYVLDELEVEEGVFMAALHPLA